MFAILTLYPQPTHLEYGKSLAQAQHHPSIHPPSSQHPKPHSLTSMLDKPPPPPPPIPPNHLSTPPTFPHQTQSSSSIRPKKEKIYPRFTSCITIAARSGFFFPGDTASCSFFSLCPLSQAIFTKFGDAGLMRLGGGCGGEGW